MTLFSGFCAPRFRRPRMRRSTARWIAAPALVEYLEDRTLLAAPVLETPAPGYITDTTPTFDWTDVAGADQYEVWVNNISTGELRVIREQTLPSSEFTPTTELTIGHSYIWTARGISSGVPDDYAPHQTFTVRPNVPTLTGPAELMTESRLTDTTPTLTWSAVTGADRYDVWVNNLTTGENQVIRNLNVSDTFLVSPVHLEVGDSYIWTVRAIAESGVASEWADHRVFTIVPEAPAIVSPIGTTSDTTPEFSWSAIDGADHYDIWVNDLTSGTSAVIREMNVAGNAFTPVVELTVGHQYIWTVRAISETGIASDWAQHQQFLVLDSDASVPEAPQIVSPIGTIFDTTPEFSWSAVDSADHYDVWVNDLTSGTSAVIREMNVAGNTFTPVVELTVNHHYIWTVRAVSDAGIAGDWAQHQRFLVSDSDANESIGVPRLLGPFKHTVDDTPTIVWSDVPGAASYELIVSNVTTGEVGVIHEVGLTDNKFTPSLSDPLDPNNAYTYSVRAYNADGDHGVFSGIGEFVVDDLVDLPFTGSVSRIGPVADLDRAFVTIVLADGSGGFNIIELLPQTSKSDVLGFDAEYDVTLDDFDYATEVTFSGGTITLRQGPDELGDLRPGIPGSGTNTAEAALGFWRYRDLTPPAPMNDPQVEMAFRDFVIDLPSGRVPLTDSHVSNFLDGAWTVNQGFVDTYIGPSTGEGNRVDASGTALSNAAGFSTSGRYINQLDLGGELHKHIIQFDFDKVMDLEDLGFEAGSFMRITGSVELEFTNPVVYLVNPLTQ